MMDSAVKSLFDGAMAALQGEGLERVLALRNTPTAKADGSFVTEGDLLVDSIVRELVRTHLPGAVVVSEEGDPEQVRPIPGAWVVVVDPIDGTENFTSGLPEWGVSISCYRDGVHGGSLLGAPELGQWLGTGMSVQRHRSRIRGLSSSLSKEQILQVGTGPEYRIIGCCVVNMMAVIRGAYLSFENPKGANTWDILAGLNLALEHGLRVEVDGKSYTGGYLPAGTKYRFKVVDPANAAHFARERSEG